MADDHALIREALKRLASHRVELDYAKTALAALDRLVRERNEAQESALRSMLETRQVLREREDVLKMRDEQAHIVGEIRNQRDEALEALRDAEHQNREAIRLAERISDSPVAAQLRGRLHMTRATLEIALPVAPEEGSG